jgi:hypothetical protein
LSPGIYWLWFWRFFSEALISEKAALFFPLDEAERVPGGAPGANKSLKNFVACVKLAIYQVLTRLELAGRKQ